MPGPRNCTPIASIVCDESPITDEVVGLAESIRAVGLINPITVVTDPNGPGLRLVSGRRRLAACRYLGWQRVPTTMLDDSTAYQDGGSSKGKKLRAEQSEAVLALATIHENLEREHLDGKSRRELRDQSNELLSALGYRRGSGGRRPGAGAPKPKTTTRGQATKAAKRSDNQTEEIGTSGNSEVSATAVTAAVEGVTQRTARGSGGRGPTEATRAFDAKVLARHQAGKKTNEIAEELECPASYVSKSKTRQGIAEPRARKPKTSPAIPPEPPSPKASAPAAEPPPVATEVTSWHITLIRAGGEYEARFDDSTVAGHGTTSEAALAMIATRAWLVTGKGSAP